MQGLFRFVAVILIVVVGIWAYVTWYMNRGVIAELEQHPQGQRAAETLLLTLPSGRRIPVNYLEEGATVFVAADGPWWRQFRGEGAPVILLIRGETREGMARVVLDDPDYVAEVFARLRTGVPDWLPRWLDGRLVVITLDG
ncbi:MAG: hypothetical protein AB7I04_19485 [Pseudomonadales bacterium]